MIPRSLFAHLDGPPPTPVVGWRGNVLRFLLDPVGYMAPLARRYGDVVPFVRGGGGPVLLREAAHGTVFAPSPYQYAPFGAGARMCLGAGLATLELKTILAMLLQRFGLEPVPNARIDRRTRIVMSPRRGLPMVVRPRGTIAPVARVRGNIREMVELP